MNSVGEFLVSFSGIQLGVSLVVTAAIVAIVIDWRLALFSLLGQYICVTLLLNTTLPSELAVVKLVAGSFASVSLYWTARRVEQALGGIEGGQAWFRSIPDVYPMGLPFRFLTLIFTSLVLFTLPDRFFAIPSFPPVFTVPSVWLLAMGLLTVILTRDPLKTGMGLLTFQNGFELLYTVIEPGLVVVGLLGIGTILVGLVASYLAVAHHMPLIETRQAIQYTLDPTSPEALAEAVAALKKTPSTPSDPEIVIKEEVPA
ncbi:MAG: hypothetical protein M3220_05710 [Chloroflexota bacterium]|nr:hypothetical protein [Chloroflexota bacterium]